VKREAYFVKRLDSGLRNLKVIYDRNDMVRRNGNYRRDAWAEGIVDGVERFLRSVGLERAIWLLCGFAAGYFGQVIWVIINRHS